MDSPCVSGVSTCVASMVEIEFQDFVAILLRGHVQPGLFLAIHTRFPKHDILDPYHI